jgi:hypothetical protein
MQWLRGTGHDRLGKEVGQSCICVNSFVLDSHSGLSAFEHLKPDDPFPGVAIGTAETM